MSLTDNRDDPRLNQTQPNGQQEAYLVLSEEERAKGFVRPVRTSYVHKGVRPKYALRDLTPEEVTQYSEYGYVKYEAYPRIERGISGRFWTAEQLRSGCNGVTTMHRTLGETYARDPKFYSGTFCSICGQHFPVKEFVWEGTDELVGS